MSFIEKDYEMLWRLQGPRLMLPPTAGNSNTSERTELLDRLRAAFPDMKIAALMGDREFTSASSFPRISLAFR